MMHEIAKKDKGARRSGGAVAARGKPDPPLHSLHSALGNRGMQRLGTHGMQPPAVSARVPPGTIQRACECGGTESCECDNKSEELPWIQRKAREGGGAAAPSRSLASAALSGQGPGRSLDSSSRAFMEPRFGRDLGGVRIHTDAPAARAAKMLSAEAFTVGGDIHFAEGRYRPDTIPGRRLLAHELTHTVQQGGGTGSIARSSEVVSQPHDASEREADSVADRVAAGSPVTSGISTSPAMIQRQDDGSGGGDNGGSSLWDNLTGAAKSVVGTIAQGAENIGSAVVGAFTGSDQTPAPAAPSGGGLARISHES